MPDDTRPDGVPGGADRPAGIAGVGLRRTAGRDPADVPSDPELEERIAAEIGRDGPISFARFMELALYDPAGGYYRGASARPGRDGDFLTAPEAHPIFGWALARQVDDAWRRLGSPSGFTLREHGAGTGALAVAILDGLQRESPGLRRVVRYEAREVEPRRIEALRDRLRAAGHEDALADTGAPEDPIDGVVLANEVVDALPVHRVVMRDGVLREVLVGRRAGRFVDVEAAPTTPLLARRLEDEGITLAEGQAAEVALAIDGWVARVAAGLRRGLLLLVDYGYPATELYDPVRRRHGTLMAYRRHVAHDDPYASVGRQDLTAHVDLTAVERAAVAAGLDPLGTTTQAELLVSLGAEELLRDVQADPDTSLGSYLELRSALFRMLDPAGSGRFRVLLFGRGLRPTPDDPLRGLRFTLAR